MDLSRVLVTGAAGFVGAHLVRALVARGVKAIGAGLGGSNGPIAHDLLHIDVRERGEIEAALEQTRPGAVVHLAGQSSAGHSFSAPRETFATNVVGTWNLLDAVRRVTPDARVLVVGTGEAYGPQPSGSRVSEDAPFRPVSPYALSKAVADEVAAACGETFGLDVVRTRSFSHTGPGQPSRFALPSFARQIASIERSESQPILKVGNLEVVRDILDVEDVADAYLLLLERGRAGAAYNVCSGNGVLLSELVAYMISLAKVPIRVEVDPGRFRPADVAYLVGSPERLVRETGWQATRLVRETIRNLLESWRAPQET